MDSWFEIMRVVIIGVACAMLVPAAFVMAASALFVLAPVGLVGLPFMLPVFFNTANHERNDELQRRASMRPGAMAHAHAH